jgi:hypothetical protein
VGALESAVHGLHAWLVSNRISIPGADLAIKDLESAEQGNPFVGLPPYMDPMLSSFHGLLASISREETMSNRGIDPPVGLLSKLKVGGA